jgi:hypothetical protein
MDDRYPVASCLRDRMTAMGVIFCEWSLKEDEVHD